MGPNFIAFGIGLGSDLNGTSELNVRTTIRMTQLNRLGGELAIKTSMGTIDRLDAEFFQPVGSDGNFFVAPRAEALSTPEGYIVDLSSILPGLRPPEIRFHRQTLFAGIAAGYRLGSYGEFRVGAERGSVRYRDFKSQSIVLIQPDGSLEIFDLASLFKNYTTNRILGSLTIDRLDDAFFPQHGFYFSAGSETEFGRFGYKSASLRALMPLNLGRWVIQPRLSVDYTLHENEESGRLPFKVGGLFNLSGLHADEVFGSNAMLGR